MRFKKTTPRGFVQHNLSYNPISPLHFTQDHGFGGPRDVVCRAHAGIIRRDNRHQMAAVRRIKLKNESQDKHKELHKETYLRIPHPHARCRPAFFENVFQKNGLGPLPFCVNDEELGNNDSTNCHRVKLANLRNQHSPRDTAREPHHVGINGAIYGKHQFCTPTQGTSRTLCPKLNCPQRHAEVARMGY